MLQLFKAKQALEEIKRAYIKRELVNIDTYGSWDTDEGLYFERSIGMEPIFVSWDSLEIWAEKYFAEGELNE